MSDYSVTVQQTAYSVQVDGTTLNVTVTQGGMSVEVSPPAQYTIEITRGGTQGAQGDPGQGVPAGGTAGQWLRKSSGTDYDTAWASQSLIDHGSIGGLGDDDHTQYLNNARGDARYYTQTQLNAGQLNSLYYTESEVNSLLAGKANSSHTHPLTDLTQTGAATGEIPIWNGSAWLPGLPDHGSLDGLSDDDHPQYHNDSRGDTRYYTKTQLNAGQLDDRYYTEAELEGGVLDDRYFIQSDLLGGVLDGRYYTELELDAGQLDNRYYTESEADDLLDLKQDLSEKGQANGYASLDAGGKVPVSQLPGSVFIYKGVWDASANTPTLSDGTGTPGWLYRVDVAGTQDLGSGSITFAVGDYVIYNSDGVWEKSDTTDAVTSVFGRIGVVTAQSGDYTTAQVTESGNLYYTDERVDDRVAALIQNGTGISWTYSDGAGTLTPAVTLSPFSTTNLSEGSNLYFTNARAQSAMTGAISTVTTSNLTASRALISNASGKVAVHPTVSDTELGFLDGATSNIQTQINGIISSLSIYAQLGSSVNFDSISVQGSPTEGRGYVWFSSSDTPSANYSFDGGVALHANGVNRLAMHQDQGTGGFMLTHDIGALNADRIVYWPNYFEEGSVLLESKADAEAGQIGDMWRRANDDPTYPERFAVGVDGQVLTVVSGMPAWSDLDAIQSLNGLTDATQTFATGTSGTNFNISSSAGVHTFNIPDADNNNRGLVTTGSQVIYGGKILSANAGSIPLRIRAASSPSTDLFQLLNSSNTVFGGMSSDFRTFWGTSSASANRSHLFVNPTSQTTWNTLCARAISSQTGNLFQVENASVSVVAGITVAGLGFFGTSAAISNNTLGAVATNAGHVVMIARGTTSQSADLQQWQNTSATVLSRVTSGGLHSFPLGAVGTPSVYFEGDANTGIYSTTADNIDFSTGGTRRFNIDANGNLRAFTLHNNATSQGSASNQDIRSGTYSPTVSNATNTDSTPTVAGAKWKRVGNVVTVSGRFTADPTLAATATGFDMTLPVTSAMTAAENLSGMAFCGAIAGQGAEITAESTADTARVRWISGDVTSQTWSFMFQYEVL